MDLNLAIEPMLYSYYGRIVETHLTMSGVTNASIRAESRRRNTISR